MPDTIRVEECRACQSPKLAEILSLGDQYVTNFVNSENEQDQRIPLELVLCKDCSLLQLRHNTPPQLTWNEQYWYKSGISSTIRADLSDIARKAQDLENVGEGDIVVDIGCNDGTLLERYGQGVFRVGFEPSKNVAEEARSKGHFVFGDFFNHEAFRNQFGDEKARIITAISMFYDLDNPNRFLEDITATLDKDGLFVIQQNYLATMLEQNAFDNICHEHREYYSLSSLINVLRRHELEVFDVEQNNINGGSIRTYIRHSGSKLRGAKGSAQRVAGVLEREKGLGLDTLKPYEEFALRTAGIRYQLMRFIRREREEGKTVGIYGASTRGNVALQYFGLDRDLIAAVADKNPDKWGKKTVGSGIPIVSPEEMRKINPDYLLVNTWHFFDEIREQERAYHEAGGKFVVALPQFRVE